VPSREEFRGTGGSLYFLRRQDLLAGSERVRIEIRDKASGIVTGVVNLTPVLDYDIDYLQGRIVLSEPLASTADDNLLVRSNALSGDETYLVVRYEYTPGFDEIDTLSAGAQAHYWVGDYLKLGVTAESNDQDDENSNLAAADVTLRLAPESWLKVQHGRSEGLLSLPQQSDDGGFEFDTYDPMSFADADADALRADLSLSSNDLLKYGDTKVTLYAQDVDAGYSAPGLSTVNDTETYGGSFNMPIADRFAIGAKFDNRSVEDGLETKTHEVDVSYQVTRHWDLNLGYRNDDREDNSPILVATQEQGERTDAIVQIGYDSKSTWNAYGFYQDTLSTTGDRQENGRAGMGGSFRVSDRWRVDAEVSDGDLGAGSRVGTNYLLSDRTSMYLTYALQNQSDESSAGSRAGGEGNLVAGMKSRLSDSTSVFLEERYQHSNRQTGLTHGSGISFAPTKNLSFGITTDSGKLQDFETGAETERLASGIQVGLAHEGLQLSSGIEYRNDDAEQLDLQRDERTTWLFRNSLSYQINPGSRLVGKFNHADSDSSLGTFYDGGYTEAVIGYAHRPVEHDRLNTLIKYTYFYNMPTTDQVTLQDLPAEYIQKSHIAAIDVTYDLTRNFTVGGKYAYRLGQITLDRDDPDFFDNNASLYVVRGDYRIGKNWELLLEGRVLDMTDLDDRRSGALATVSRYLGDHLKVGVGYNFTDFSDDLTDLSYDHHGYFLNLTGTM
jgi:hypothetical protein